MRRGHPLPGDLVQMFKLQVKERGKKDKCTCMIQLCAFAYAYSTISLCCTITAFMIGRWATTTLISIAKNAKWLLKVICFERYIFKLKIEPVPVCTCLHFHNKPKRLEYLWWHPICLVDWVYLLRTLSSHYLLYVSVKYSSTKNGFQVRSRVLGFPQNVGYGLKPNSEV